MKICKLVFRISFSFLLIISIAVPGVLLTGCGSGPDTKPDRNKDVKKERGGVISFSLSRRKLIEVDAEVNGTSGVFFLYPTFQRTILFRDSKLIRKAIGRNEDNTATQEKRNERSVRRFKLGDQTLTNLEVLLVDRKTLAGGSSNFNKRSLNNIDGILGYNLLKPFRLTIHYPKKLLHLKRVPIRNGDRAINSFDPRKWPFKLTQASPNQRKMVVDAGVNGEFEGGFVIDPGVPLNFLARSAAKKWGLKSVSEEELKKTFGLQATEYTFHRADRLWVCGTAFRNVLFRSTYNLEDRMGVNASGILGYIFLSDKILQIDFPRRLIHVQKKDTSSNRE